MLQCPDTVDETTADAKVYGYTILLGVGVGCYCQAGFPVAQMKVAAKDMASSVGFMTVSQMLGIAVGTGMSGAIYVNTASQGLERLFPDATRQEISSALAGVGSNLITSAGPGVAAAAVHAIARAIQFAFAPLLAAGALSFLCSILMKREKVFG